MSKAHWRWTAVLAAVAVMAVGATVQMIYVHDQTGHWGLSVSAARAPSRVHFEQRDYDHGEQVKVPSDAVRRGRTDGGGIIYKPAGDQDQLSVIIYVSDGMHAWKYGLVGGP